jgi:hypothetical protein
MALSSGSMESATLLASRYNCGRIADGVDDPLADIRRDASAL